MSFILQLHLISPFLFRYNNPVIGKENSLHFFIFLPTVQKISSWFCRCKIASMIYSKRAGINKPILFCIAMIFCIYPLRSALRISPFYYLPMSALVRADSTKQPLLFQLTNIFIDSCSTDTDFVRQFFLRDSRIVFN